MITSSSVVAASQSPTNRQPVPASQKKPRLTEEKGTVHPEPMCLDTLRIDKLYSEDPLRYELNRHILYQVKLIDAAISKVRGRVGEMISGVEHMREDFGDAWSDWLKHDWTMPSCGSFQLDASANRELILSLLHEASGDREVIFSITVHTLNEMIKRLDELSVVLRIKHRSLVFRAYERLPPFFRLQALMDNTIKGLEADAIAMCDQINPVGTENGTPGRDQAKANEEGAQPDCPMAQSQDTPD